MSDLNLSPEQIAFLLEHHEAIERAIIEVKKGNSQPLNDIAESDAYYALFGDMLWDDALDRYEDSPAYDLTLRIKLHEQLQADIAAGKVQLPSNPSKKQPADDEEIDNNKPDLVILKQLQSKK